MVRSLNDDRRDAIAWLVDRLRWERTLDRLRSDGGRSHRTSGLRPPPRGRAAVSPPWSCGLPAQVPPPRRKRWFGPGLRTGAAPRPDIRGARHAWLGSVRGWRRATPATRVARAREASTSACTSTRTSRSAEYGIEAARATRRRRGARVQDADRVDDGRPPRRRCRSGRRAARPEGARRRGRREARRHGACPTTRSDSPATCSAASVRSVRSDGSPTVLDASVAAYASVFVSGGRRGLEIELAPRRPRAAHRRDARGDRAMVIRPCDPIGDDVDVDVVLAVWRDAGAVPERDRRRRVDRRADRVRSRRAARRRGRRSRRRHRSSRHGTGGAATCTASRCVPDHRRSGVAAALAAAGEARLRAIGLPAHHRARRRRARARGRASGRASATPGKPASTGTCADGAPRRALGARSPGVEVVTLGGSRRDRDGAAAFRLGLRPLLPRRRSIPTTSARSASRARCSRRTRGGRSRTAAPGS